MKEPLKPSAQPIFFFDDRSKIRDRLVLVSVLYEDEKLCLCTAKWKRAEEFRDVDPAYAREVYTLLFDKESHEVLHKDWDSWLASHKEF